MTTRVAQPPAPWFVALAYSVLVLNLVDAVFTLIWVTSGHAVEANPLMAAALDKSPLYFMIAKLALVSGGVALLWRTRPRARFGAAAALTLSLGCYVVLLYQHLSQVPHLVHLVRDGLRIG